MSIADLFLQIENHENLLWSVHHTNVHSFGNEHGSLVLPPPLAQTKLPQKTVFFTIFLNVVLFTAFNSLHEHLFPHLSPVLT